MSTAYSGPSRLLPFEPVPKLPMRPEEALQARDEGGLFVVAGQTFAYTFSKANGLMTGLQVLSDDFSARKSFALPDAYLSPERDPREKRFAMRHEGAAEFTVVETSPERVMLRASGHYRSEAGEPFPIRYTITHRIYIDGLDIITIQNQAESDCELRWLCLSRATLPASLCSLHANLPDQALRQVTDDYHFARLPDEDGEFLTGLFLPWFWLGNQRTGVEVTTWEVTPQHYQPTEFRFPDGRGWGDSLSGRSQSMFVISRRGREVSWENFAVRNVYLPLKAGWSTEGAFALAVTPAKPYRSALLGLRPVEGRYGMPGEQIEQAARRGANYLESLTGFSANPPSATESEEIAQNVARLHERGIKVVPYVSATDLRHNSSAYDEHGPEWRLQPGYSFQYRSSGMCPWAEGWRDHFKRLIDRVVDNYDFDGIYIDMWYGQMACENPAHGDGRFRHVSFLGLRDMLAYAYNRIKSKKPDAIIFNNTNVLPIAYITSLSDIRLVGESMDVMGLEPLARSFLYFSYRLGSQTAWSTYGSDLTTEQKLSLGLLICSLLPRHPYDLGNRRAYSEEDVAAFRRYRDILRFFGVEKASLHPALADQQLASASTGEVYVNVLRREDSSQLLLTVVNMNARPVRTTLSIRSLPQLGLAARRSYLVYEPARGKLIGTFTGSQLKELPVSLPAHGHALLYIREATKDAPDLVYALGADGLASACWDRAGRVFEWSLQGPAHAETEMAIISPARPRELTCGSRSVPFAYQPRQKLVKAASELDPGRPFRLRY